MTRTTSLRFAPVLGATATFCLLLLAGPGAGVAQDTGRQGRVFERLPDGGIGPVIPGAAIQFIHEDGSVAASATSDANGWYQALLEPGRYHVTAKATGYETYTSDGYSVVREENGISPRNFFLHAREVEPDGPADEEDGTEEQATGHVAGSVRVGSGQDGFRLNFNARAEPLGGRIRYAPAGGPPLRGEVDVCFDRAGSRVTIGGTLEDGGAEPYFEAVLEDHGQGRRAPEPDRAAFQTSATAPDCDYEGTSSAISRGNVNIGAD